MKKEELDLIIKEGEGLTVEFKEKYTSKIVSDIAAMANAKGGKIILGVADDGKINGEKLTGPMKAEIFSLGRNCDPEIEVTVKQIDNVVVVEVPEGHEKPYSSGGAFYKRFDAVTQKLTRTEIKAIFEAGANFHYDEKTNPEASLADISLKKVKDFYKASEIKFRVTGENLPSVLQSLNLMKKTKLTNAALLFFAERIDNFFLHSQMMFLAFKDYEGSEIFDRKEVRSDLLTQFNEAEFFMKRHLSLQAKIKGMKRENVFEVPQEAWREAIANAIIHRDYRFGGTSIQIRIFPDRIEVISPGELPSGVTPKNIGSLSSRRNEVIADMFARLDVIEKAGTGITRIKRAMKAEGLPMPKFEDMGKFFKITLLRPKGTQKRFPEKVPRKGSQKIGKSSQKIIELIRGNSKITVEEMAKTLGISDRAVKKNLALLKEKGIVNRIGPDRGGDWEVTEE